MLRVLTIIFVVIGLTFVAWSYLVMMTGVHDRIAASMAPAEEEEAPKEEPADSAEAKVAEAEPTQADEPEATTSASAVDPAGNPLETARAAEKGMLKSPYRDTYRSVAEEGHKK